MPHLTDVGCELILIPILQRRHPRMFLEITPEERLVGKAKLVRNLLNAEIGGLQQCLDFQNDMAIYNTFSRCTGNILHHCREIARSNE